MPKVTNQLPSAEPERGAEPLGGMEILSEDFEQGRIYGRAGLPNPTLEQTTGPVIIAC
jgi:hypothetical protein